MATCILVVFFVTTGAYGAGAGVEKQNAVSTIPAAKVFDNSFMCYFYF
jgi:hypothetical protein